MHPQLQQLVVLQEVDLEIIALDKRLKVLPEQMETSRSHLAKDKEQLDNALKGIKEIQKKRSKLEQDVQIENDHMAKIKVRLPAVKTNKEYSAILAEVDAAKQKISALEDEELSIMEILEKEEKKIPDLQNGYKKEEQEFQEFKKQKEAEIARINQDLEARRIKRAEIAKPIEAQWLGLYEKLIKHRGEQVVVLLKEGVCRGCFQQIRPQMAIEIRTGEKVHQCSHCNRILYWVPEPETETAVPK
ncbi:MAG: hypothetical protein A3K09_07260 [Nitrospinae bacterium RIFCSPLOWO2_12_FULL_47_7]|nr:MAG: hypothetical protein A3K09_07260 [Nitrospinae bacterium RIFCSPLOWO2_12_FULL_47_7]